MHGNEVIVPRLSVLVCTRNRAEKAVQCVTAILANSCGDFELVVVDQSTDDKTREAIAACKDRRIRYIPTNTVGLARSRNIAVRTSVAETIVFTDDDCISDKDWLSSIVAEYAEDPSVTGVFGRVLAYGTEQNMFCPCLIENAEKRSVDRPVIPHNVLGHGNNMSFKRGVFQKTGLFVESLGAGTSMKAGEDTEFIYRALRKGQKFVYSPRPLVFHDNWRSHDGLAELMTGYLHARVAVFTKFSLELDKKAFLHVLQTAREVARNRTGAGSGVEALASFSGGLFKGMAYRFVAPPRLEERVA
jgi:glycosyltransferase involved in cell wall biosynthesis